MILRKMDDDSPVVSTTPVTPGAPGQIGPLPPKMLEDAAMRVQRVLADPPPAAKLAKFGADGLEFQLLYWIDDPQNGQLNVRSVPAASSRSPTMRAAPP